MLAVCFGDVIYSAFRNGKQAECCFKDKDDCSVKRVACKYCNKTLCYV